MGSDQCDSKHRLVDRCCNGVCFGFGFVVTTITLTVMFWIVWLYFGLTVVQFSNSQRRAIVDYSYVPASTSSPNRNTPSEIPESSLNQISKFATVSSSFPRIDQSEVNEKKKEILNGRAASPAKRDFAARPRSNKTSDVDERRRTPNYGIEGKPNTDVGDTEVSREPSSLPNKQDTNRSIENNQRTQLGERRTTSTNTEGSILPTRVIKSEITYEKTASKEDSTRGEVFPSSVLNSRFPEDDFTPGNPDFGNNKDRPPKRDERNRAHHNGDDFPEMPKGDNRNIPDSQSPSRSGLGLKSSDSDDRRSDSSTRRRGDEDSYDPEDRSRDRIPYDDRYTEDRKREDDKYGIASTRKNRNQDRIDVEDRFIDDLRDRRRGDAEKYDDKPIEDRYRDRITSGRRYIDAKRGDSEQYDYRDRRLGRDRDRISYDDEYSERYPNEERRNKDEFPDRTVRDQRYRDRLPEDDRRSFRQRNEGSREPPERFDEGYPKDRSTDRKQESRYRDETGRRYDDSRREDYDRRKTSEDDDSYRDRIRDDRIPPNDSRRRTDDRYIYRDETADFSKYDSKEDPYRGYEEKSKSETRGVGRDSLMSSRSDYRPNLDETKFKRQTGSTRNDQRYLSSDSRSYMESDDSDLNRGLTVDNRNRGTFKDEDYDRYPHRDGRDRITPTRVEDDRYIPREPIEDTYDSYDRKIGGSYSDSRRSTVIDSKYRNTDDRSRTPTRTRIESSRDSSSSRREYQPTDKVKNPRLGKDEVSLERRSYSSEEDEYRLSNANARPRTNQPAITPYDDRRRDYRSDHPNKRYADEDEYQRSRRTNVRNRDSVPKEVDDRDRSKNNQSRDVPGSDRYNRDRDAPIDRDESNREQDRYNRNGDRKYDRSRDGYDDRNEDDRNIRHRDRYDDSYKESRYDQNRDRYEEDRYEKERYDRNRDRFDEDRYDRNRDKFGDDARYETRRLDRNRGRYDDDSYDEGRYDRPFELRPRDELSPQDDKIRSRNSTNSRSRDSPPSRSNAQVGSYVPPSDRSEIPFYPGVDDRRMGSKATIRGETSMPSTSGYEADRPLSAKDVIDAALRQAESAELNPKKVHYPVFDPRISNLTSSDIIRPSERRGITITSRRRRKRELDSYEAV